jgi:hypothetical protein
VSNLVQPMMVGTFFEWEGQKWSAARKDINPFFAHSKVVPITLDVVKTAMEKTWGDVHTTDFLNESHSFVKFAVLQLLGGMPLDDAGARDLNEIMDYFIRRNSTGQIPVFNQEDSRMIKKMTPFGKRMIEWNK